MTKKSAFALVCLLFGSTGCGLFSDGGVPLEVVQNVEIDRYMGKWYEIAKYPNPFEQGCFGVTATYEVQPDGTVSVLNVCKDENGAVSRTIEGFATIADPDVSAKLTVYFFWPFGAPYWIIELDDDYQYAVVGDPSRTFLWILSRTPTMDPAIYDEILQRLPARGYDPAQLELMTQFPEDS